MNAGRTGNAYGLLFLCGVVLVIFWRSFLPDHVLFTQDDPFGLLDLWKEKLPEAWLANWTPWTLVGLDYGSPSLQPYSVLLWLLPTRLFINWIYALDTIGAAVFFFLFLRQRQLSAFASALGALVYGFASPTFSLVYSGHVGKFGCLFYFAATLWALEHALTEPKAWSWKLLVGVLLGLTVAEQPDPAIFYVGIFSLYLAFRVFRSEGMEWRQAAARFLGLMVLTACLSGLIASQVLWNQFRAQIKGVSIPGGDNKAQAWNWATQWSFPPEETLELVAPGFFGWRIDNEDSPYWGRSGRTPGYKTPRDGIPRFKFDNSFIGLGPLFLAGLVTIQALRKKRGQSFPSETRREIIFWAILATLALLLAFGRYFFLYRLAYFIPPFNVIRNPAKFIYVFSAALAVLSAYGLQYILDADRRPMELRWLWKLLAALGGIALVAAIGIFLGRENLIPRFQAEFQDLSGAIVVTMAESLFRVALTCGILAMIWFRLFQSTASSHVLAGLLVLLSAADLYLTNRHYVDYRGFRPTYAANELVHFLKSDPEPYRIKVLPRNPAERIYGLYNLWLTIYFPYHRIQTFDVSQMPRMPLDYQQFLQAFESDPARLWQLTNCKYLVGPAEYWKRTQSDSTLRSQCSLAYAYDIALSNEFLVTSPANTNQFTPNTQVVIRYDAALPRMQWFESWRTISDDHACLRTLASSEFDPRTEVIVSEEIEGPKTTGTGEGSGKIEWLHRTDNVAQVRVTGGRGILLFNEKHDPNFIVTVDGTHAPLLRCNYIMKGVLVAPGTHEVRFEYRPPRGAFYVSLVAWVGCGLTILLLCFIERRQARDRQSTQSAAL